MFLEHLEITAIKKWLHPNLYWHRERGTWTGNQAWHKEANHTDVFQIELLHLNFLD